MEATVGFLLENIKDLVIYNADLITGAADNSKALCKDLDQLKAYVKTCTEKYAHDDFLKELAKNVRKLVYRAEDAIETYIAAANRQRNRNAFRGALHAVDHAIERRNISKELEDIQKEVRQLIAGKLNLGVQFMLADKGPEKKDKKPVFDDDNEMVGFKDAMDFVMGLLNGGPEDFQTVSIVGMLGLGKTTLASKVFKHPTMEYKFFVRAFVEVSAEYKADEVFLKILNAIGVDTKEIRKTEECLIQAIRGYLENRNFFIVLDDVWTREAWDDLKRAFPANQQKHSRILITTRNKPVAEYARQEYEPYDLRFLEFSESQELLRKKVFGKEEFPAELEEHETTIINKCAGLPLSIVVVAGVLRNNRTIVRWWDKLAKNVDPYNAATDDGVKYVIELSYKHLPPRLRQSFLYLGVFREDFEISLKTLLPLWVSEGFVPLANGEETSEDIAEDYLEELVDRNLVMVVKRRLNGRIKSIRVHDTLREFCKTQARTEELFREIKMSVEAENKAQDDDFRLCVNSNILDYIRSKPSGKYVRSFLTFSKDNFVLPVEQTSHIPRAFKFVRVLDIRSIKLTRFPAEIYNCLLLLKYLAMFSELKIIPEKMSYLRYLQTIIFITTQPTLEIKADIWKMGRLRHLVTNATASLAKTTEALTVNPNLHTLTVISAESCTKEVFDRATELKKLAICGTLAAVLNATGSLFDCLQQLEFLENLKLLNDNPAAKIHSLPSETRFPSSLTRLTLKNTMLPWPQMSILGKLRKLEVLKLKDNAFVGAYWKTESRFPSLKVLHIANTDLVTWSASASYFPMLTHLHLMYCTKFEVIPRDLINSSTLRLIQIYCCNAALASSARKLALARLEGQTQDNNVKATTLKLLVYPPDL
jgi:hypothetical protein